MCSLTIYCACEHLSLLLPRRSPCYASRRSRTRDTVKLTVCVCVLFIITKEKPLLLLCYCLCVVHCYQGEALVIAVLLSVCCSLLPRRSPCYCCAIVCVLFIVTKEKPLLSLCYCLCVVHCYQGEALVIAMLLSVCCSLLPRRSPCYCCAIVCVLFIITKEKPLLLLCYCLCVVHYYQGEALVIAMLLSVCCSLLPRRSPCYCYAIVCVLFIITKEKPLLLLCYCLCVVHCYQGEALVIAMLLSVCCSLLPRRSPCYCYAIVCVLFIITKEKPLLLLCYCLCVVHCYQGEALVIAVLLSVCCSLLPRRSPCYCYAIVCVLFIITKEKPLLLLCYCLCVVHCYQGEALVIAVLLSVCCSLLPRRSPCYCYAIVCVLFIITKEKPLLLLCYCLCVVHYYQGEALVIAMLLSVCCSLL